MDEPFFALHSCEELLRPLLIEMTGIVSFSHSPWFEGSAAEDYGTDVPSSKMPLGTKN